MGYPHLWKPPHNDTRQGVGLQLRRAVERPCPECGGRGKTQTSAGQSFGRVASFEFAEQAQGIE